MHVFLVTAEFAASVPSFSTPESYLFNVRSVTEAGVTKASRFLTD